MLPGLFGAITKPFQGIFGINKIASLEGAARQTLANVNFFLLFCEVALLFFVFYALIIATTKIYSVMLKKKLEKILQLLCRVKNEILLLENDRDLSEEKKLEVQLSFQETIGSIGKHIEQKFFVKKTGKHNYKRILDSLNSIKEKKIDVKTQLLLLDNLITLIRSFLK